MNDETNNDAATLAGLMHGHVITQIVAAAVRCGMPEHLGRDQPISETELAELVGIPEARLHRFIAALTALGLTERVGDRVRGTELMRALGPSGDAWGEALMSGSDYYTAWAELDYSLATGESAFARVHGCSLWEKLADDTAVTQAFSRTMQWNTKRALDEIQKLCTFPTTGIVADLGAGEGSLVAELLLQTPALRAILVDQEPMMAVAKRHLSQLGMADRCQFVVGDIRNEVPNGADLYILKAVLHNWPDEDATTILRACRSALHEHARLLIVERIAQTGDLAAAVRDLTMLVLFGSEDRSAENLADLVAKAGLAVDRLAISDSGLCCLTAYRAQAGSE